MTQKSHLTVTQAGVTAMLVALVGQVAAFVPSVAAYQQVLVSAGSFAIAVGFLLANAIHHLAAAKTPATPVNVRDEVNDVLRGIVAAGLSAQAPPAPAAAKTAQPPPPPAPGAAL